MSDIEPIEQMGYFLVKIYKSRQLTDPTTSVYPISKMLLYMSVRALKIIPHRRHDDPH